KKQVFYTYAGPRLRGHRFLAYHMRPFYNNTGTQLLFVKPCLQLHMGNSCDRCHGFTPETHRTDREQIISLAYFRGGMPLKTHTGISYTHPAPIINNLYQG